MQPQHLESTRASVPVPALAYYPTESWVQLSELSMSQFEDAHFNPKTAGEHDLALSVLWRHQLSAHSSSELSKAQAVFTTSTYHVVKRLHYVKCLPLTCAMAEADR